MLLTDTWTILLDRHEFFLQLLGEHLAISGIAILFSSITGLLLGLLVSRHEKLARYVIGTSNILYTIPAISMLGFLIPLTGIGNATAIIALSLYGLLPVVNTTYTGLKNVDPELVETAIGMGSSPNQLLYKIMLPLALPVILSGIRTMTVMVIAMAGIASFIGAGGLGVAIYRGITTNNTAMTIAGSLLIALAAFASDCFFAGIEKRIPWR